MRDPDQQRGPARGLASARGLAPAARPTAARVHRPPPHDAGRPLAAAALHRGEPRPALAGGRRRAQRQEGPASPGAVRGAGSIAFSSLLVNAVLKRLFGRVRPDLENLQIHRRLRREPGSLSFPSGHSSSAAAFVTGLALESPAAGAALAPVALGVGYSRVHVGVHYPGTSSRGSPSAPPWRPPPSTGGGSGRRSRPRSATPRRRSAPAHRVLLPRRVRGRLAFAA
ncbi:phosphatase PAP2 family protein [Blastococcus brunescens]|uniref:phosphatase PAP2 family protein n=1 Tax=Blastococcus brunescens TaxID=1564165 RepID=UPI003BEEE1CE